MGERCGRPPEQRLWLADYRQRASIQGAKAARVTAEPYRIERRRLVILDPVTGDAVTFFTAKQLRQLLKQMQTPARP